MDVLLEFEEMNVVDNWFAYQFEPYYKKYNALMGSLLNVFTSHDPFLVVNNSLSEMAAFKAYIKTNPNKFKPNAHLAQVAKVNEAFKIVEDRFYQYLSGLGYAVEKYTVNTSTANFKYDPIAMYGNVSALADNYRMAKSEGNATVIPPVNAIPIPDMVPPKEVTTTTSAPPRTNGETMVFETSKSTGGGGGLLLGLGIAAAILFFATRKKDKKDQK
ncbi:hypothetical protein FLJC2902T_17440 [Flavobacterium limnosediminis JC2902]|uniref:Uncharacterized protein n=1 Tax=Flavobacterium limnosediminis JC2902 TaxID=1341181 RepID=V6SPL3_9FLAO|nr:hypothetical protein [Flavobacterium limnosediminis]ESU28389.1 hypothetical protein FLJC2902T_17440 [Flavobacterium limnosediminis JC2902]